MTETATTATKLTMRDRHRLLTRDHITTAALEAFADLAVSLDVVRGNFARYGLLDEQVRFLEGWFRDTLPSAPIDKLAVLRMDGDLYESTMDALVNLYPKLSPGGFAIIDDWGDFAACEAASLPMKSRRIGSRRTK